MEKSWNGLFWWYDDTKQSVKTLRDVKHFVTLKVQIQMHRKRRYKFVVNSIFLKFFFDMKEITT